MSPRWATPDRILLGASAALLVGAIGVYWHGAESFADRVLIVGMAAYLICHIRLSRSRSITPGFMAITGGILLAPPAWFLTVQVGPRPILLWWLALSWLCIAVGWVLIRGGWVSVRNALFPLCFVLFALPVPLRVEQPVQRVLQEATTSCAAWALPVLGVPVERFGFVLRIPNGDLGVIDACSGIRSVSALVALGALLAYWRGLGLVRGSLFVGLGIAMIVAANIVRVIVSGLLVERVGLQAIEGSNHDVLGYATALLAFAAILALSRLFPRRSGPHDVQSHVDLIQNNLISVRISTVLLTLHLFSTAVAGALGWQTASRQRQMIPLEEVSTEFDGWKGEDAPIPESVREMLTSDRLIHRVYRNRIGHEVHVWVMFWSGAGSVRGYHHPDVCWPNRGWDSKERTIVRMEWAAGRALPLTVRKYERNRQWQMVCYWTQEGNRIWKDADEEVAHMEGTPGHRWVRERLVGEGVERSGRLAVLVGCDLWDTSGHSERSLIEFCRMLAVDLYRVAPWAAPLNLP